ncbi:hypothetical protein EPUL_001932 [Erysiphe pulchra]|uniref:RNase H type-1 domain-containing protein n=1 Tax=Erysiphe pulchra TaxID=225359 RepID=A0A2S4PYD9_9PEZI|nr:hypothetical protein EPUL_001932 [Erysiphe pulchra]
MAPTSSIRVIPPELPEAVKRITKHKTTVSKPSSSSKSSRMLPFTTKAARKAEVLEKTQIPTEDTIESMEIQIESTTEETPLSASNISQEVAPVNLIDKTDIAATLDHKQNFRLASIDLDYPGPYEKLFDEPLNYDEIPPLAGSVEEELNNVVNINNKVTSQNAAPDENGPLSTKFFKSGTDDRLFLRLLESNPLQELSGYALQTHLKAIPDTIPLEDCFGKTKNRGSKRSEKQMSRVQRAFRQLPQAESAEPLQAPKYVTQGDNKNNGVERFNQCENSIGPTDISVFSDGSSIGHGRSSWGYCLLHGNTILHYSNHGPLHGGEVYDAEIVGAFKALERATNLAREGQKIYILLNNQAAV